MALERIVTQIQRQSQDTINLTQLKDYLKVEEKEIARHKQEVPAALEKLDASLNSLGYLILLYVAQNLLNCY